MLWYKSWLETRWRFSIGLRRPVRSAVATVLAYPQSSGCCRWCPRRRLGGEVGRRLAEIAAAVERDYRGYIWAQWLRQNMTQMGTLFAVLLGTGGLLPSGRGRGALHAVAAGVA